FVLPLDAPHLRLKPEPRLLRHDYLLLRARPYGELDRARWLSVPLALHGHVVASGDAGGTVREFTIGEAANDPVLAIPDLEPHLARNVPVPEMLDVLALAPFGSAQDRPTGSESQLRDALLARGVPDGDLLRGEWSLVPADPPRF